PERSRAGGAARSTRRRVTLPMPLPRERHRGIPMTSSGPGPDRAGTDPGGRGVSTPAQRPSPLAAARAFGVMLGGPAVLAVAAAAGVAGVARALVRGCRPSSLALAGVAATAGYVALVRPWMRSWGATAEEAAKAPPGDELVPEPGMQTTRAVTID